MSGTQPRKIIHMVSKAEGLHVTTLCKLEGRRVADYLYSAPKTNLRFMAVLPSNTHIGATCKHCRARMFARRQNNERSLMPVR